MVVTGARAENEVLSEASGVRAPESAGAGSADTQKTIKMKTQRRGSEISMSPASWGSTWHQDGQSDGIPADSISSLAYSTGSREYARDNEHDQAPAYQHEWDDIYISEKFRPNAFRILTAIFAVYFGGFGMLLLVQEGSSPVGLFAENKEDRQWAWQERLPLPVGSLISLIFLILFYLPCFRCLLSML